LDVFTIPVVHASSTRFAEFGVYASAQAGIVGAFTAAGTMRLSDDSIVAVATVAREPQSMLNLPGTLGWLLAENDVWRTLRAD